MSVFLSIKSTWTHHSNVILLQGHIQKKKTLTFKCVKCKMTVNIVLKLKSKSFCTKGMDSVAAVPPIEQRWI